MSTGAELIAAERQRQIDTEGWTPEHDDEHGAGELVYAALNYAAAAINDRHYPGAQHWWPWGTDGWNPSVDPIRNLVKAGALIAAEIDRIQRKASS